MANLGADPVHGLRVWEVRLGSPALPELDWTARIDAATGGVLNLRASESPEKSNV